MFTFFALTKCDEYSELAVNLVVKSRWENPYNIDMLLDGRMFMFPESDGFTVLAICLLLAALLLAWFNLRVNRASVYRLLTSGLALLGLDFALGLQTPFPSILAMLTGLAAFVLLLSATVVIVTILGLRFLPYFGVPEQWMTDLKTGDVTYKAMLVFSAFSLIVFDVVFFRLFYELFEIFIQATLNDSVVYYWLFAALLTVLGAVIGREFLPWVVLSEEQSLLGGGYLKKIGNLYAIDGDADVSEIVKVGIGVCVLFVGSVLYFKESVSVADLSGFLFMIAMCLLLGRAIIHKEDKEEIAIPETVRRKRNMWN